MTLFELERKIAKLKDSVRDNEHKWDELMHNIPIYMKELDNSCSANYPVSDVRIDFGGLTIIVDNRHDY